MMVTRVNRDIFNKNTISRPNHAAHNLFFIIFIINSSGDMSSKNINETLINNATHLFWIIVVAIAQ